MVFQKGHVQINRKIDSGKSGVEGTCVFTSSNPKHESEVIGAIKRVPERYKRRFLIAHGGKSKTTAIKAKCYECCNYEDLAVSVGDCKSFTCPLWKYRPRQPK